VRHRDVPPNSAGSERAKEFVRLAETLFWPTDGRKSQDGFFDGLLNEEYDRQRAGLLDEAGF